MGATSKGSSAGHKWQKKKGKEKGSKYVSDVDSKFWHNSNFFRVFKELYKVQVIV